MNDCRSGFPYAVWHTVHLDYILKELRRLQDEGLTLVDMRDALAALVGSTPETAKNADRLGGTPAVDYLTLSRGVNLFLTKAGATETYLAKTATAADSAKLGGVAASEYATKNYVDSALEDIGDAGNAEMLDGKAPAYYITPYNYLDNSNFKQPVNQRGQTSYTTNGYCIDRWRIFDSHLTVENGYVSTREIFQFVPNVNQTANYTIAVKQRNKTPIVYAGKFTDAVSGAFIGEAYLQMSWNASRSCGQVTLESAVEDGVIELEWAALYEGVYGADTLPPYLPKGYSVELSECLRYFERFAAGRSQYALPASATSFGFSMNYWDKRIVPTFTFSSLSEAIVVSDVGFVNAASINAAYSIGEKCAYIAVTASNLDTSKQCALDFSKCAVEISADL